jgi:uncharacterized protein (UPF0332 family)
VTGDLATALMRAERALEVGRRLLEDGYLPEAARQAYFAVFNASVALIETEGGRVPKSHSGLHGEVRKIAEREGGALLAMQPMLGRFYKHKQLVDYGDPGDMEALEATLSLEDATRFVTLIKRRQRSGAGG